MNKHTVGPWYATGEHVQSAALNEDNYVCRTEGSSKEEVLANALLIAAAPDLLAALESILAYAENEAHTLDSLKDSEFSAYEAFAALEAVDSARAAIAKAKGE